MSGSTRGIVASRALWLRWAAAAESDPNFLRVSSHRIHDGLPVHHRRPRHCFSKCGALFIAAQNSKRSAGAGGAGAGVAARSDRASPPRYLRSLRFGVDFGLRTISVAPFGKRHLQAGFVFRPSRLSTAGIEFSRCVPTHSSTATHRVCRRLKVRCACRGLRAQARRAGLHRSPRPVRQWAARRCEHRCVDNLRTNQIRQVSTSNRPNDCERQLAAAACTTTLQPLICLHYDDCAQGLEYVFKSLKANAE